MFAEWVKEIDQNFRAQKRNIALIIDNCHAHPDIPVLDWVELIFLPPNTTLITQPMDQGVTPSLKAKYHFLAVKRQIDALEKGNQLSILTMSMLTKAWKSIPDGTFTNYFKNSGISEKSMEKALKDENDPFTSLDVEENVMESLKNDLEMTKEKSHEN